MLHNVSDGAFVCDFEVYSSSVMDHFTYPRQVAGVSRHKVLDQRAWLSRPRAQQNSHSGLDSLQGNLGACSHQSMHLITSTCFC